MVPAKTEEVVSETDTLPMNFHSDIVEASQIPSTLFFKHLTCALLEMSSNNRKNRRIVMECGQMLELQLLMSVSTRTVRFKSLAS